MNTPSPESSPRQSRAPQARRRLFARIPGASTVARAWRVFAHRPVLLAATVLVVGATVTFGGTESVAWMETPNFCSRCHPMAPETTAHALSTHRDVDCGECHVGSGIVGLARAKLGGLRQTVALVRGKYARPIPPAAKSMPPASETCGRCHVLSEQRGDVLITRSHFQPDAQNTEQQVGLVLRLSPGSSAGTPGIHWHATADVEYVTAPASGDQPGAITWVGVDKPDGTRDEYIARGTLDISAQADQQGVDQGKSGTPQQMSCYDCHNRVGHDFPTVDRALDTALADGRIDKSIPYIKKRAADVLNKRYSSSQELEGAVREMIAGYYQDYPNIWLDNRRTLEQSFVTLVQIYQQSDHPEMNVTPADYPNQLGHSDAPGCFRCHDGGHNKVVNGRLTNETIPSTCSTCHTFPSAGAGPPAVPLGRAPDSHARPLYVFDHKSDAGAASATNSPCAACHSQSYCANCHSSGAKLVKHDEMKFDHAAVIRDVGQQACASCHQQPFCARCHAIRSSR